MPHTVVDTAGSLDSRTARFYFNSMKIRIGEKIDVTKRE
jgi:hypothetical protein